MFNKLLDRFRQYPTALQMLIAVLAVVAGIMIWNDYVWKEASNLSTKADLYESAMSRAVANEKRLSNSSLESAVKILGDKLPPGRKEDTKTELSNIINKVLSKHKVTGRDVAEQTPQESTRGRIRSGQSGGKKLGIVATKVRFEAEPAEAYSVIAELETHKAIETVSNVRIGRSADPRSKSIVVQMTVEGWYYSSGSTAAARGRS